MNRTASIASIFEHRIRLESSHVKISAANSNGCDTWTAVWFFNCIFCWLFLFVNIFFSFIFRSHLKYQLNINWFFHVFNSIRQHFQLEFSFSTQNFSSIKWNWKTRCLTNLTFLDFDSCFTTSSWNISSTLLKRRPAFHQNKILAFPFIEHSEQWT